MKHTNKITAAVIAAILTMSVFFAVSGSAAETGEVHEHITCDCTTTTFIYPGNYNPENTTVREIDPDKKEELESIRDDANEVVHQTGNVIKVFFERFRDIINMLLSWITGRTAK